MIAYILKSALTLAMLYCVFTLLLSRETLHRFNRMVLLCIISVSLVLPVVHLQTSRLTMVGQVVQTIDKVQSQPFSALKEEDSSASDGVYVEDCTIIPLHVEDTKESILPVSLTTIYLLGLASPLVSFSIVLQSFFYCCVKVIASRMNVATRLL